MRASTKSHFPVSVLAKRELQVLKQREKKINAESNDVGNPTFCLPENIFSGNVSFQTHFS